MRENFLVKMSSTTEFQNQFEAFANFGTTKSDGKHISLRQSDKWMKQGNVFDKGLSTNDTAISFEKMRQPRLSLTEYLQFLEDLTSNNDGQLDSIKLKMASCGLPAVPKMKKVFTN